MCQMVGDKHRRLGMPGRLWGFKGFRSLRGYGSFLFFLASPEVGEDHTERSEVSGEVLRGVIFIIIFLLPST